MMPGNNPRTSSVLCGLTVTLLVVTVSSANAQVADQCDFSDVPGTVWWGTSNQMTLGRLASYLAPVFWFSPDEPLLGRTAGTSIVHPQALPFESGSDGPVVYYQFGEVLAFPDADDSGTTAFVRAPDPANSVVDFRAVATIQLSYYAYFDSEVGVGAHEHDIEGAEFKVAIRRSNSEAMQEQSSARCDETNYVIVVTRVTAKAHGIRWFWNVMDVDADTRLPMFLLVEEGKHALATDKNSDGYYSPGYDVSHHVNDAWGVRDNIRGGLLFTGGFEAWMAKVRRPEYRVLPPLPDDSPLIRELADRQDTYVRGNAVYELRPYPSASLAQDNPGLHFFMRDKDIPDWPEVGERGTFEEFEDWLDEGTAVRSLSLAFALAGSPNSNNSEDLGLSLAFPLLIVRNVEAPALGGFLVWRAYFKDVNLQDQGLMVMYTPSASRWIDTYLAAGAEWDAEVVNGQRSSQVWFVLETGLKFRVNISNSPLRFMGFLTNFWGVRAGIRNYGGLDIKNFVYVLEIGAGVF